MGDPKTPQKGDTLLDASDIALKDLTPTQMQELPKLRDGHPVALANLATLLANNPAMLKRAGIDPDEIQKALALDANRKKAQAFLPAAEKLTELLRETIVSDGAGIADILTESTNQAERRASKDPHGEQILATLEDLRTYQNGPAAKGAATKETNKKTESAAAKEEATKKL